MGRIIDAGGLTPDLVPPGAKGGQVFLKACDWTQARPQVTPVPLWDWGSDSQPTAVFSKVALSEHILTVTTEAIA